MYLFQFYRYRGKCFRFLLYLIHSNRFNFLSVAAVFVSVLCQCLLVILDGTKRTLFSYSFLFTYETLWYGGISVVYACARMVFYVYSWSRARAYTNQWILMRVCVCVCERYKEGYGEGEKVNHGSCIFFFSFIKLLGIKLSLCCLVYLFYFAFFCVVYQLLLLLLLLLLLFSVTWASLFL